MSGGPGAGAGGREGRLRGRRPMTIDRHPRELLSPDDGPSPSEIFTEPEKEQIRVISARNATRREQCDYEEDAND